MKVNEIKEALSKATPGPWEVTDTGSLSITKGYRYEDGRHITHWIAEMDSDDENERKHEDAHLIANAPEWLASLVSQVEEMQKTLEWYASRWNHEVQLEDIGITSMQHDVGQRARDTLKRLRGDQP